MKAITPSQAGAALGRVKSEVKSTAARANGAKGGRPGAILKGRSANRFPGDTAMELLAAATDSTGRVWSKGSLYQPQSAGQAGGGRYQDVIFLDGGVYAAFAA